MQRRKFSREFKLEAVELVRERGVAVAQAARVLSDECGPVGRGLIFGRYEPQIPSKTAQLVPLFQFVTRGDPPGGDDVCAVPAVAA